jgi:tetratricopeptide (TPR) repeat protein/NAD-dependent SIR2 family protein deacetylase
MDPLHFLPEMNVIATIKDSDPREFALFLGAGASRSSGVPLGSEMIAEWQRKAYDEASPHVETFDAWVERQPWRRAENVYSALFEALYPEERSRQIYIEKKVEPARPGWGYLYLANILRQGKFNVVFTTNFDNLLSDALTRFVGYTAVVCAADSLVGSVNAMTARAKIVKLHGDYLYKKLKNTDEELDTLDANMATKFREFGHQCGFVVLGYAGRDRSVLRVLEDLLASGDALPRPIYWGLRNPGEPLPASLAALASRFPKQLIFFQCPDFDLFMARLHDALKLEAPMSIVEPIANARRAFNDLLAQTGDLPSQSNYIAAQADHLRQALGGELAQVQDPRALELYEAQLLMAARKPAEALARVARYCDGRQPDAMALTLQGGALTLQAEDASDDALLDQALTCFVQAAKLDPKWIPARMQLIYRYNLMRRFREALVHAECLRELIPQDISLRQQMVQLYASAGRVSDALKVLDGLLEKSPNQPDYHVMRGNLLVQLGQPGQAVVALQRAAEISPTHAQARFMLANGYSQLGKTTAAAAEFNLAIRLEPDNPLYRIQAAIFFMSQGQTPLALPHLEEAVRLNPESAEARGWLATALAGSNRVEDARAQVEAAVRLDPKDARLLVTAAHVHLQMNRPDLAEPLLQQAVRENPEFLPAQVSLAQFYWGTQQPAKFQAAMQAVAALNPQAAFGLQQQLTGGQPFAHGQQWMPGQQPGPGWPAAQGKMWWSELGRLFKK